jgi:hypothetical protein
MECQAPTPAQHFLTAVDFDPLLFDYRVKAPDEHRLPGSTDHAASQGAAVLRKLVVCLEQGE